MSLIEIDGVDYEDIIYNLKASLKNNEYYTIKIRISEIFSKISQKYK